MVGRYISEEYGGQALHPIDIMDASTGRLLQQLADTNLTTISPVIKMHPRRDVLVSGSSWWEKEGGREGRGEGSTLSTAQGRAGQWR